MTQRKFYVRRKGTAEICVTYGGTLEGAKKWFAVYFSNSLYYLSDEEGKTL